MEDAMQTPDGAWRVEVVQRGRTPWYRIVHGDSEVDWPSIAVVERILTEAGIDLADLEEVHGRAASPVDDQNHGAA